MSEENLSVEVVASWASNPLDSALLSEPEAELTIGPGTGCWLRLPSEVLSRDHVLVEPGPGGWVLNVPPGGAVSVDGTEVSGDGRVPLKRDAWARVQLGDFHFHVRVGDEEVAPARRPRSLRWTRWLAVAAILHGIVLAMFAMSPPDASALNVEGLQPDTRYVSMSLDGHATPTPPPIETAPSPSGSSSAPGGDAGGGETATPTESASPGERRPHGRNSPTFVPTAENVNDIGALAVLSPTPMSFGDGSSPYTAGSAEDGEGGLANARLLGLPHGPGWGMVDMQGHGHGTCDPRRQDCDRGLIGVGDLDTHDPGAGGHRVGLGDREGPHGPPRIRTPQADTLGALSREQVRRTVRRHINEIRFCYSQQLQSRPDLEGRVAVRFIVSPTGAVQSTAIASNTVGSSQVASCVEQAVGRWTFPAAPGVTGVTYPFVMQSR